MEQTVKTLFKREHSEEISNPSDNRAFSQVAEVSICHAVVCYRPARSPVPAAAFHFC